LPTLTIPYPSFAPGGTILSSEMNANFTAISTLLNGLVDAANLANGAVTENKLGALSVATAKIQDLAVTSAKLAAGIDAAKIGAGTVSDTEFGYLNGVTSALQTQLDGKQPSGSYHVVGDGTLGDLMVFTDTDETLKSVAVTEAEALTLQGVSSNIQNQLNAKQAVVAGVSDTEIGYLANVTSDIQTQLNSKEGALTLTANRAVISNGSGAVTASAVTSTELGYLGGVTSAIQTQFSGKLSTAAGAVGTTNIADDAVTAAKLATGAALANIVEGAGSTMRVGDVAVVRLSTTLIDAQPLDSFSYGSTFSVGSLDSNALFNQGFAEISATGYLPAGTYRCLSRIGLANATRQIGLVQRLS